MSTALFLKKNFSYVFYSIFIIVLVVTIGSLAKSLNNDNFWFDETNQLLFSQGQDWTEQYKTDNTISHVIKLNSTHNHDPIGFTILLHYWTKVSNNASWIRLLPFLFFLSTFYGIYYLVKTWTNNNYLACILLFTPILSKLLVNYGFESRPYSFEFSGAIYALVLAEWIKKNISYRRLLISSIVLGIYLTSRYGAIFSIFSTSIYICYLIFNAQKERFNQKIKYFLTFALPIFSVLILIYFTSIQYHMNLEYSEYLKDYTLKYNYHFLTHNNVLKLNVLILTTIILCVISAKKQFSGFIFIIAMTTVLIYSASIGGFFPSNPTTRWGITLNCYSYLCIPCLVSLIYLWAINLPVTKRLMKNNLFVINISLIILLALIPVIRNNMIKYTYNPYTIFANIVKKIEFSDSSGKIFSSRAGYATIKYLFEYGCFKDTITAKKIYPHKFNYQIINPNKHDTFDRILSPEELFVNPKNEYEYIFLEHHAPISDVVINNSWTALDNTGHFWKKKNR